MADKIPQANLDPKASEWVRWVNSKLAGSLDNLERVSTSLVNMSKANSATVDAIASVRGEVVSVEQTVTRAPAIPDNVQYSTVSRWDADGNPVADLTATWSQVRFGTDGNDIEVASYEVWLDGVFAATSITPTVTIKNIAGGRTYLLTVRASTPTGTWGPFSAPLSVTTANSFPALGAPSAPTLSSDLGSIIVDWDGKLANGTAPSKQFAYVTAYMSATQNGTYVPVGQNLQGAGSIVVAGEAANSTRWFKLVLVDKVGQSSPAGASRSVTVSNEINELSFEIGNAVSTSLDEYVVTNSATVVPGPEAAWSSDTPDWVAGEYVWRRTKNTHINGDTSYSSPAMLTGNDGTDAVLLRIASSRGTSFKNNAINTVLTVTVFKGEKQITNITELHAEFGAGAFLEWWWRRMDDASFGVISSSDTRLSQSGFALTVSPADVDEQTVFQCILQQ